MSPKDEPAWWQTGIFYNVYVRSFKDSNGDGIGDLTGVIDKLDYLSETLGVAVIWLSGMLASPWKEFGFDISDLRAVHPAMGNLEVFDELLRQAHARGLKVLVDWVPNHTSNQHSWFLESRSSHDNPKRDWYIWRDPKPDGTPPNNWLSLFGGPAWEWDEYTWQYYLHTFLKEQPDLNWRNPEVKQAMFDEARFWLERGVDGFRVDAAHHLMKDRRLRDNPPGEPRMIGVKRMAHEYQEHIYDRDQEGLHPIFRQFRQLLDEHSQDGQPRAAFAEVHPAGGWKGLFSYFGKKLDEFHFPFFNGFIPIEWKAQEVRKMIDEIESLLPAGAWPNAHTGNFDEWRVATRFGLAAARTAAMLLLTLRGTPMLYYGEEIGMTNVPIPPEFEKDPFGKRVKLSRDPQRTPMQWTPSPHAGFSDHLTPGLWLPISSNHRNVNVENQLAEPDSMLNLYRKLIAFRKSSPALTLGSYRALDGVPEDCFVYLRDYADERLLVALNFSPKPQTVQISGCGAGEFVLSTALDREGEVDMEHLELRGNEGVIVKLM